MRYELTDRALVMSDRVRRYEREMELIELDMFHCVNLSRRMGGSANVPLPEHHYLRRYGRTHRMALQKLYKEFVAVEKVLARLKQTLNQQKEQCRRRGLWCEYEPEAYVPLW